MLCILNPFPIRIPSPVRWRDGEMQAESISFDGTTIRVRYPKRQSDTRGWYDSAAVHELTWCPELRCRDDVLAHYQGEAGDKTLIEQTSYAECGAGHRIRLRRSNEAGGKDAIYLVSEGGENGALRLWSSRYQKYSLTKFEIGRAGHHAGQGADYLELSSSPTALVRTTPKPDES